MEHTNQPASVAQQLQTRYKSTFARLSQLWEGLPSIPRDVCTTIFFLVAACVISAVLLDHTGVENNSALVFVAAVMLISVMTNGYNYGIIASLVGGFCTNYFFMYPYEAFSLSYDAGYPVAMLSMLVISFIVCTLTSRVKQMAVDAVKREQKTKALYELNQKLSEEKNAIQLEAARETIRGNILRSVSHDLRTPLTSISGAASVLLSSEEMQSERNLSLLTDIKNDADALITMVENLLSTTRIQEGSIITKDEELLEEVAGDAVLTIRRRFPKAKVDLMLPEDMLMLPMEPMLIRQVMVNLLENAIRHSGDTQNISLALSRQGRWAVAAVRDHGKGLPPDVKQAILAGRQLPRDLSGDSTRGMGIGLSVCQSIIKAHDGFFDADNAPGGGAVFRFGLPLEESNHG